MHTCPAVLARLLFPHLWSRCISHRWAPPLLALGWAASTFITYISPPNVDPWTRILAVSLASITGAAGDVFWLGRLRYYGKPGLTGWGIGTGLGGVTCAVLPYTLTVYMGKFLRHGLGYAWYLVPLMLASQYLVLPSPPSTDEPRRGRSSSLDEDIELDDEVSTRLLDQSAASKSRRGSLGHALGVRELGKRLMRPYILPLALGFAGSALVFPGFARATRVSSDFETYATFIAGYGWVFQMGNLITRSSLFSTQPKYWWFWPVMLAIGTSLLALDAFVPFMAGSMFMFGVVAMAGMAAGWIYMAIYTAALEDREFESGAHREFGLGLIGAGESIGVILGGLASVVLEASLCGGKVDGLERWCDTTR